jgi:hypothetical protein
MNGVWHGEMGLRYRAWVFSAICIDNYWNSALFV